VKKCLCMLVVLGSVTGLYAETFSHKFTKGEKFRIVASVEEKVLNNDELVGELSFLNKIAAEVTGVVNGTGGISALYQISGRGRTDAGVYHLESEARSSFTIGPQGRYRIGPIYFEPQARDIPLFPEGNLEPEASWTAPAEEVYDLREPFGIRTPVRIPVNVNYRYRGDKTIDGKRVAQFEITYEYRYDVENLRTTKDLPVPKKISGAHSMLFNWDIAAGKPHSYEEEFYALYNLSDGQWMEFMGTAKAEVFVAQPLDKKKTADDINREIEKEKIEGARAESSEEGVKITLENIQFQPDSDVITAQEHRKIEKISAILKKYPDRDVRLTGHTAAVGTPESCLELSIRRAKSVGDVLLQLGARRADQMTIEGKGLTQPVAPSNSEAGRSKNRRVEITILEN
jgi:outer membrane protein OmpA-like peptidoglycan-associated protein